MAAQRDQFVIQLDGGKMHPGTMDTVASLDFAAAYLALVQTLAGRDEPIFVGLEIKDKCVQLLAGSAVAADTMAQLARTSALLANGKVQPSQGQRTATERVRKARAKLPDGSSARIIFRDVNESVDVYQAADQRRPFASLSVRAKITRVGTSPPRATFESRSEKDPFTLDLGSEAEAEKLGKLLNRTVDIKARVARSDVGRIEVGTLRILHELDEAGTTGEALTSWFKENGQGPVDDEEGLGRLQGAGPPPHFAKSPTKNKDVDE